MRNIKNSNLFLSPSMLACLTLEGPLIMKEKTTYTEKKVQDIYSVFEKYGFKIDKDTKNSILSELTCEITDFRLNFEKENKSGKYL